MRSATTPLPWATTSPTASSPSTSVAPAGGGYAPLRCSVSARLMALQYTRNNTSFAPGTGTGRSTMAHRFSVATAARIVGGSAQEVALGPPLLIVDSAATAGTAHVA